MPTVLRPHYTALPGATVDSKTNAAFRAGSTRPSTSGVSHQSFRCREIRDRFCVNVLVRIVRAIIAVGRSVGNGIEHRAKDPDGKAVKHLEFRRREFPIRHGWPKHNEHASGGRAERVGIDSGGEWRRIDYNDVELQAHSVDETTHQLGDEKLGGAVATSTPRNDKEIL